MASAADACEALAAGACDGEARHAGEGAVWDVLADGAEVFDAVDAKGGVIVVVALVALAGGAPGGVCGAE